MNLSWKNVFADLSQSPDLLARFLNSISLMEYMGARKILKSQHERDIDERVLAHMQEEIRHAQVFKRMAVKLSEGRLTTYAEEHLLAGAEARAYIQSVDQSVAAVLQKKDSHLNYLLSTLLIEERANSAYPFWAECLKPYGLSSPVEKILKEEEIHLKDILESLQEKGVVTSSQMAHLRQVEEEAFSSLIEAVHREIALAKPLANLLT